MYLKHLSHTHNIAFSLDVCDLCNPPASKSDVRPCVRAVVRAIPWIFDADAEGDMLLTLSTGISSASTSLRGYGEKYLHARFTQATSSNKEETHHVLICHIPKLTLSKFLCAVILLWCRMSKSSSVMTISSTDPPSPKSASCPFVPPDAPAVLPMSSGDDRLVLVRRRSIREEEDRFRFRRGGSDAASLA